MKNRVPGQKKNRKEDKKRPGAAGQNKKNYISTTKVGGGGVKKSKEKKKLIGGGMESKTTKGWAIFSGVTQKEKEKKKVASREPKKLGQKQLREKLGGGLSRNCKGFKTGKKVKVWQGIPTGGK